MIHLVVFLLITITLRFLTDKLYPLQFIEKSLLRLTLWIGVVDVINGMCSCNKLYNCNLVTTKITEVHNNLNLKQSKQVNNNTD